MTFFFVRETGGRSLAEVDDECETLKRHDLLAGAGAGGGGGGASGGGGGGGGARKLFATAARADSESTPLLITSV